jgi:hypothetical protein
MGHTVTTGDAHGHEAVFAAPPVRDEALRALDTATVLADLARWWDSQGGRADPGPAPLRIADGGWDQKVPVGADNPYWEIVRQLPLAAASSSSPARPEPMIQWLGDGHREYKSFADRFDLCGTYSWSIPSPGDVAWLREILGGRGVVEAGAGGGYWAWQMRQAQIDVAAYEPEEAGPGNAYARRTWTAVLPGDHAAAARHPDRALFLCWPSYGEPWAARALACYDGDLLVYAGEREGGYTADAAFFGLRAAEWEEAGESPAHVSFWGINCRLTAYARRGGKRI